MDEVVKSGAAQRTYLYGLRRISQTQVASGTTSYYGYDAHGDVRSLMNNGGVVTDTYDYDAFGNLVGSTERHRTSTGTRAKRSIQRRACTTCGALLRSDSWQVPQRGSDDG